MTRLVLSLSASDWLRNLSEASVNEDAEAGSPLQDLRHALVGQPPPSTTALTGSSTAVPTTAPLRLVLDHSLLVSIAKWTGIAKSRAKVDVIGMELAEWKLSKLVAGAEIYISPKPKFERSQALEDSLAAIRRAHEEAEYAQISRSGAPMLSSAQPFTIATPGAAPGISKAYINIAGTDPTLPLGSRIASQFNEVGSAPTKQQRLAEDDEWKNVQRQLSVILNIFLSVMATATAAWWASGTADVATKVLTSLGVALVTAVAEIVLYNRYQAYVTESRRYGKKRMTGSDLRDRNNFKPLNFNDSPAPS